MPLIRPSKLQDKNNTLLGILERKASEGVQICILMYNDIKGYVSNDSAFQEKQFKNAFGIHQHNVHVLRHPEHQIIGKSVWFWSHHEKLVVLDQRHAFCGGSK